MTVPRYKPQGAIKGVKKYGSRGLLPYPLFIGDKIMRLKLKAFDDYVKLVNELWKLCNDTSDSMTRDNILAMLYCYGIVDNRISTRVRTMCEYYKNKENR